MGMPSTVISFREKQNTFIRRLGRGIIAYVIVDEAATTAEYYTISNTNEIEEALASTAITAKDKLITQLRRMFLYGATKILVCIVDDAATAQTYLELQRFNYLAMDAIPATTVTWAEGIEFRAGRKFQIISDGANCTSSDAEAKKRLSSVYPTHDLVDVGTPADIAAIVAGSSDRSATYQVLAYNYEVDPDKLKNYPGSKSKVANDKIDTGFLTVVNDGEKVKVGRAVNTYYHKDTDTPANDTTEATLAKIRNVDICNMIEDDIRDTFENEYVGQVINNYDNKMAFIATINATYLKGLEGTALEVNSNNQVDLDVEEIMKYAKEKGEDIDNMTEMEIRRYNTGSHIFLAGTLNIVDTMEDLQINFIV